MRKVLIGLIGLMLVFVGCIKRYEWDIWRYRAPNWTSDGKIVFMRDHYIQKFEENELTGAVNQVGGHQDIFVCEIDADGSNFREVCKIVDEEFEIGINHIPISTSSAGEYVVISKEDWTKGEHYTEMFIMKRDGTGLKNLGEGSYPDLSPDGKRIVYQKPNQGLWIKNIDGSGDRQIVGDERAQQPAWSPLSDTIAYAFSDTLVLLNTLGNVWKKFSIDNRSGGPDWSTSSDTISLGNGLDWKPRLLSLVSGEITTLNIIVGGFVRWSPDKFYFIGHDEKGYFIIKRDGENKWYLKP